MKKTWLNTLGQSIITAINTAATAIKAKTDNLPGDPASDSTVSAVGVVATAVKAKTDNLPASPANEISIRDLLDGVYIDTQNGVSGTAWPIGTPGLPVDNMTDALVIASSRNTNIFHIMQGLATLPSDFTPNIYSFYGHGENSVIDLNGQNTYYARFHNTDVNGVSTGSFVAYNCQITDITAPGPNLYDCTYYGTVISAGVYMLGAYFVEAVIDLTGNPYVIIERASGSLEIKNMTQGDIWIYGNGLSLTIDASCVGGTINVYGNVLITNNGSSTLNNCTIIGPAIDSGSNYNVEIAHGTTEQTLIEVTKTNIYAISIYTDLSALIAAGEGGTVTLRLYNKVDESNYIKIATAYHTIGVTEIHPNFEVQSINDNCKVTIQLSSEVTAQRTINYRYITKEL